MDKTLSTSHTILFADIADSTQLYDRLGDTVAKNLVATSIGIMNDVVRANSGMVVKTIGDGVMGRFRFPDEAADTAVRLHETMASDKGMVHNNVRLRIGFHHGPVIEEDSDLFGDAVNIAARMAAQAKAGQIITSRQTFQMLNKKLCAKTRMVDQTRVKGKSNLIDIFEITWGHPEELTIIGKLTGDMANPVSRHPASMTLAYQNQHIRIGPESPNVTLGRDQSNRLVIPNPKVSRLHARIEIHKGKFVLIDESTNGTYLYPEDHEMIYLRRDEFTLERKGYFSLGQAVRPESNAAVRYLCL